jgi:sodium/proline symporter
MHRERSSKHFLWFSRLSVLFISLIAYVIAVNPNASIMILVSDAWAGFGACFSALILLSLYWKRTNRAGAIAGIITGGLTVIFWNYVVCVPYNNGWSTLSQTTGLYSLAPGFLVSLISIIAVSMLTKEPSQDVIELFEQAATKPIYEE